MAQARRYPGLGRRLVNVATRMVNAASNPFLRFAAPGHFYSPIPSTDTLLESQVREQRRASREAPGIDLQPEHQVALVTEMIAQAGPLPCSFGRYQRANGYFDFADAWTTYAMLRRFRPRRVIEIGSGHSSAVMLDTADHDPAVQPQFTFVDPFPERLYNVLNDADRRHCDIREQRLQDVPRTVLRNLKPEIFSSSTAPMWSRSAAMSNT